MKKRVVYENLYQSGAELKKLRPSGILKLMGANLYHVELQVKAQWQEKPTARCKGCGEIVNPVQNDCTCYTKRKGKGKQKGKGKPKTEPRVDEPEEFQEIPEELWPRLSVLIGTDAGTSMWGVDAPQGLREAHLEDRGEGSE